MNSKKILVVAAVVYSISAPMIAMAKKPHPAHGDPAPVVDYCECSAFTLVPISGGPFKWVSRERNHG